MRTVSQRVSHASVKIDGEVVSEIGHGFLVLLGIEESDNEEDMEWLVKKIAALRVFDDEAGVMNRSVVDVGGNILVVSQFTLMASYKKGNLKRAYIQYGNSLVLHTAFSLMRKLEIFR